MARTHSPLTVRRIKDLTDADIRYFRDNPDKLDLINDRTSLHLGRLLAVLLAAFGLVLGSKLLAVRYADEISQIVNDVLVDLVFEMGAALIGSVATVIFIELQQKRQFEENLRLRFEIERRIALAEVAEKTTAT